MIDFFSKIWGVVETLLELVWSLVESLLTAIVTISSAGVLTASLLSIVPAFIGASITIVFAIAVVKFIIAR